MRGFRLSLMLFLQYLMLPVWLVPLLPYVETLEGGAGWIFAFGILTGIGTFASPFVCMFADRCFNSEKVLAACNLAAAVLLGLAYFTSSPPVLFALLLLAFVAYMPTWSVSTAIAMAHSSPVEFPRYRTLGSIGWVVSGVFSLAAARWFGIDDFDVSRRIFAAGAVLAAAGAAYAATLPRTPPKGRGGPLSAADVLGLKAFALFRDPVFAVFGLLLFLSMVPFQWYMFYNPVYLAESGFRYITMTQNLGQVGEILILLAIPSAVRRFGYRAAFSAGFVFMALRYALFFAASRYGCEAGIFCGILTHGFIFGFIVVVGQMYVGECAPPELRNQAQGLVILLTCGVGVFASNLVMHPIVASSARAGGGHDWSVPFFVAFAASAALAACAALFFRPAPRAEAVRQGGGPA